MKLYLKNQDKVTFDQETDLVLAFQFLGDVVYESKDLVYEYDNRFKNKTYQSRVVADGVIKN